MQQAAIDAQQAAIAAMRPGVTAESVAEAANEVYRERGYETGYRTGRSIGMAYLESPELKQGDKTVLQPGMTFAVDGGISVDGRTRRTHRRFDRGHRNRQRVHHRVPTHVDC